MNDFHLKRPALLSLGVTTLLILGGTPPLQAESCRPSFAIGDDKLHLPCLEWLADPSQSEVYQADLQVINAEDFLLQWGTKTLLENPSTEIGAIYTPTSKSLYIPAIDVQTAPGVTSPYEVMMKEVTEGLLGIVTVKPLPSAANNKPQATPISRQIDLNQSYQVIQLAGSDADGDTLTYELLAPSSGEGYTLAYLNPSSNTLYVKVDPNLTDKIKLSYRVTDGYQFSDPALVILTMGSQQQRTDFSLGSERIGSREFAGMPILLQTTRGQPGASTTEAELESQLPDAIDLSDRFPVPGDQGSQNSCVGWAIAYGVKSYQEALEYNWSLGSDTPDDILFSPAFIFNQLNGGKNSGIRIDQALKLLVEQGVATLATMPYQESDFTSQPTTKAFAEAKWFKASSWAALKSTSDIKQALAKGLPVIASMAIFDTFKNLKGSNSLYNTAGTYQGDHAVVIVGYDDNHTGGGAFKLMNSYGIEWGDNGFFWVPYTFLPTTVTINGQAQGTLLSGTYVIMDEENNELNHLANTTTTTGYLPNLEIVNWQVSYDPKIEGVGILEYTLTNSGLAAAPTQRVEVSLVLSPQPDLDPRYDEFYVVEVEPIPFALEAGQAVSRDENNPRAFEIPAVPSGEYYFHLVVDLYDDVEESNEDDNVSASAKSLVLETDLPDLAIDFWYAELDYESGKGTLEYVISNQGETVAQAPPGENLKMSLKWYRIDERPKFDKIEEEMSYEEMDRILGRFPIWETSTFEPLPPIGDNDPKLQEFPFVVSADDPVEFSYEKDVMGNPIPGGVYELVFTIDSGYIIEQAYRGNDISFSGNVLEFDFVEPASGEAELPKDPHVDSITNLPESTGSVKRGQRQTKTLGKGTFYNGKLLSFTQGRVRGGSREGNQVFSKTNYARDQKVIPIDKIIPMPK